MVKDAKETMHKILDKLGDLGIATMASHPVVMALGILAGSNLARILLEPGSRADLLLDGLYVDARNIALASAIVPIVPGALGLLGSYLASRETATKATTVLTSAPWPQYTEEFRQMKAEQAFGK